MTTEVPAAPSGPAPANPAANPDSLGIDREFLMSMARLPLIAAGMVLLAALAHQVWAFAAPDTTNYGTVVVLCGAMLLSAFIDGWAFKVPNWITLSTVLSGWMLGLLHTLGWSVDGGQGGIGMALFGTFLGWALLFPVLFIGGMGQGDVKMQMGFGAWCGAFFASSLAVKVIVWGFVIGVIVGGVFGLVMMACRRKFGQNAKNFKEIFVDLQVMVTQGPAAASKRAFERRSIWDKLPYGVPLCVGFLLALWWEPWLAIVW